MIRIITRNGRFYPQVFCDHCGERIADAAQGNYQWRASVVEGKVETEDAGIVFTHKTCCRAFEEANGGRAGWMWGDLELLPLFLEANLGIDHEKARRHALELVEAGL